MSTTLCWSGVWSRVCVLAPYNGFHSRHIETRGRNLDWLPPRVPLALATTGYQAHLSRLLEYLIRGTPSISTGSLLLQVIMTHGTLTPPGPHRVPHDHAVPAPPQPLLIEARSDNHGEGSDAHGVSGHWRPSAAELICGDSVMCHSLLGFQSSVCVREPRMTGCPP